MNPLLACDEDLIRRLPLPLAQLYRCAHNAKTPLERHLTAFYLWGAALKLLVSVAIVDYAERADHDPQLAERLTNLARPALGHWWEFVRRLVPVRADGGEAAHALHEANIIPRDIKPGNIMVPAAGGQAVLILQR